LYAASQAGVQIDLIVRGICSLRPGIKGLSENIRVRSIIGRFLEHSRIFLFANGGKEEIYCGSADWMPRNLFERCEVIFPIRDAQICNRIRKEILAAYLADSLKARLLDSGGTYHRVLETPAGQGLPPFNSQEFFMRVAEGKSSIEEIPAIPDVEKHHVKHPAKKAAVKASVKERSAAD
jgi:polyphosphate kinase